MNTPNLLLFGKDGQLGWELTRSLAPLGHLISYNRTSCNLADLNKLQNIADVAAPNVIVNAAAYTAVDKAEEEPLLAHQVNHEAVAVLSKVAKQHQALLIHYSTDYVFNGKKSSPYVETDQTEPLSVYGYSKLMGEVAIRDSGCEHLIFRTSWLFAARGKNFAKTILQKAREHDTLNVINDQFGAPTSAKLIADITALCLQRWFAAPQRFNLNGLYHLTANGETSWHGYATYLLEKASSLGMKLLCTPENVKAISTSAFPLPAKRPANSRLDTSLFSLKFGLIIPPWQDQVSRLVTEFAQNQL